MRRTTATATSADMHDAKASGWQTLRRVAPYLWPDGQAWVKRRVVLALVFLLAAKLVAVTTPWIYKLAVDRLAGQTPDTGMVLGLGAVGLVVAYGLARLGAVLFGELRDGVFVRVGQRAIRRLAIETFAHIHRLSLRYHITRKTGGLSRIIERGVKGVDFLLRFLLFSIGPLILELSMVAGIFALVFGWQYAAVVVVTIALYVGNEPHGFAHAFADECAGGCEHLAHAGAAFGAFVAQHDHVAVVDFVGHDGFHQFGFGIEHARGAGDDGVLEAGDLGHAAFGGEVAF